MFQFALNYAIGHLGPRPVHEHEYGKVALSYGYQFPSMGINFENERDDVEIWPTDLKKVSI